MRDKPTWRIPIGILLLLVGLIVYAVVIARFAPGLIGTWPILLQTVVYIILGVVWLVPFKRFLIWMETGSWKPPGT